MPENLRVGVLPDESKEQLKARYDPLLSYLGKQLGINFELVIPENYEALLNNFADERIDIAYFGGVTFLKASQNFDAVPMVMRDADLQFTSYFIARADDSRPAISDFEGGTLSFGSTLSTSGHLMPRYFLGELGIDPDTFFNRIDYSGKHDLTAFHVRDGKVDIGAANAAIIDSMFTDGRLSQGDVRIVYETPPYADYVWAMRAGFSQRVYEDIRAAFLFLSPADEQQNRILMAVDAGGFLPASDDDFKELKTIFSQLGF